MFTTIFSVEYVSYVHDITFFYTLFYVCISHTLVPLETKRASLSDHEEELECAELIYFVYTSTEPIEFSGWCFHLPQLSQHDYDNDDDDYGDGEDDDEDYCSFQALIL